MYQNIQSNFQNVLEHSWNYKSWIEVLQLQLQYSIYRQIFHFEAYTQLQLENFKSALQFQQESSFHSECVGCAWRFREWSRSLQRIQNPGGRWIHRGGGPSSGGVGEAWEGRPANGQSQVSGTLSIFFKIYIISE